MPEINALIIEGSGNITAPNTLTNNNINLCIKGSGNINAQVKATNLNTNIDGSGTIALSGTVASHYSGIKGSGKVAALDLATDQTNVNLTGSGDVEVNAQNSLAVIIKGSGNVYYKGNPNKSIQVKESGKVVQVP